VRPTAEFFETLGQYIYEYVDNNGLILYVGKGVGDRCLVHLKDKGYVIDHCHIVARNLEKFIDKPSLLLESYMISNRHPQDNIVAGHYKECFKVASLSSMFSDFQSDQFDNFEKFPDWYIDNYHDTFKNRIAEIKIRSSSTFMISNARNSMYMMWYWSSTDESIKVTFEINQGDDQKLEHIKNKMFDWLSSNGYNKKNGSAPFPDGKKQKFAITVESIDEVIVLFKKFMS